MRLVQATVKNFRSIDSLEIELDPQVTVLMGKNDSGKTNLLQALRSIDSEFSYGQRDLPYGSNLRNDYDPSSPSAKDMITFVVEIAESDIKSESLIVGQLVRRNPGLRVMVTKRLDNQYSLESQLEPVGDVIGALFREVLAAMTREFDTIMERFPGADRWYRKVYPPPFIH